MSTREAERAQALPLERLEAEITTLAGHLAAGECRWLLLIAEYDRRAGYEQWGCRGAVQWLSWHCGLDVRSAQEKLRVSHALHELPCITEAFGSGQLSYSKVRALTRIATPDNEAELVMLAEHATGAQLERIVRAYRRVRSTEDDTDAANRQHARRYLRFDHDADGSVVVHGRLPGEIAALIVRAIGVAGGRDRATNVDSLAMIAESFLAHGPAARDGGDRNLLLVNVDVEVLSDNSPTGACDLDDGSSLARETARRLACDASVVAIIRHPDGTPTAATTRTRTIPCRLRRVLHARDRGCRFPGCGERRFVDAHHIHHWARGGSHDLENLVELCWHHHRLVHEGGWTLRLDGGGGIVIRDPAGNPIPPARPPAGSVGGLRQVTSRTPPMQSRWRGDALDLDHITTALWCIDQRNRN